MQSSKSRGILFILIFFFGAIGVHRFYVGKIWTGLIYMLTFGLCGAGVIYDFVLVLFGWFKDKNGDVVSNW